MNQIHNSQSMRPILPPNTLEQTVQDNKQSNSATKSGSNDFSKMLQKELETINFSNHAKSRIRSRNIDMTEQTMEKLNEAIEKAEAKGAKESLVLLDNTAFVVSVENRTVITAADEQQLKDNVFTNIDSAVIV